MHTYTCLPDSVRPTYLEIIEALLFQKSRAAAGSKLACQAAPIEVIAAPTKKWQLELEYGAFTGASEHHKTIENAG